MGAYVAGLEAGLRAARVHRHAPVAAVRRDGGAYRLDLEDRAHHGADVLILATHARQAADLLGTVPAAAEVRGVLRRFAYTRTRVAVHGDRRLMPPRRREWSVVNVRWDGTHSQTTMWQAGTQPPEVPVFKGWVTHDAAMPQPLHVAVDFERGRIDRAYAEAQRSLAPLQGRGGLWLAGVYTNDIDSHESTIRSAVTIAGALAPESVRLRRLTGGPGGAAAPRTPPCGASG
jgi:hypothetical protein